MEAGRGLQCKLNHAHSHSMSFFTPPPSMLLVWYRYSQDRVGSGEGATLAALGFPGGDDLLGGQQAAAAPDPLQRLWFQVLQGYVVIIR